MRREPHGGYQGGYYKDDEKDHSKVRYCVVI